eukprot:6183320-Pleurochrysis_carterae.AAC.1
MVARARGVLEQIAVGQRRAARAGLSTRRGANEWVEARSSALAEPNQQITSAHHVCRWLALQREASPAQTEPHTFPALDLQRLELCALSPSRVPRACANERAQPPPRHTTAVSAGLIARPFHRAAAARPTRIGSPARSSAQPRSSPQMRRPLPSSLTPALTSMPRKLSTADVAPPRRRTRASSAPCTRRSLPAHKRRGRHAQDWRRRKARPRMIRPVRCNCARNETPAPKCAQESWMRAANHRAWPVYKQDGRRISNSSQRVVSPKSVVAVS